MYTSMPKPAKASLWFIICFVIQRGLQFISMPIFTRIMSQEEYGEYSVFLSWFNLLCVFTTLNIYSGVVNKALVKYEHDRDSYISSVLSLTLILTLVFSVCALPFVNIISSFTGFSIRILLLMCVHLLSFPAFQFWAQKQRFDFEYKYLVLVTLISSILNVIVGILLVLASNDKSLALISVTVAVQIIINGVLMVSIYKKGHFCLFKKDYWKWSLLLALPLVPHYLSEILLGHADRIMINSMCGSAQAGIYNIVYQISMVMTILRTGINGSFTPWMYQSMKHGRGDAVRRTTNGIVLIMAFLTAFLVLVGPEILMLAAPNSYYEGVIDIPAIMLGCFFIFIYVLFLNVEVYYEKSKYAAIASGVAAIISISSNLYCIPHWGYLSCGYTTMLSYMLMAVLHYIFFISIRKVHTELIELFDIRFMIVTTSILIVFCVFSFMLYNYTLVRWGVVSTFMIITYFKKELIINTIKTIRQ